MLKHGPTFEVVAQNKLDDGFNASPALVDNELYLRGFKTLYCILLVTVKGSEVQGSGVQRFR